MIHTKAREIIDGEIKSMLPSLSVLKLVYCNERSEEMSLVHCSKFADVLNVLLLTLSCDNQEWLTPGVLLLSKKRKYPAHV